MCRTKTVQLPFWGVLVKTVELIPIDEPVYNPPRLKALFFTYLFGSGPFLIRYRII